MGGQKSPGVPPSGHQPANHSCGTGSWWPVAAQSRPMAGSGAGLAASHAGARRGREMVTSLGGAITVRALSTPAFSELPQVLGRDLQLAVTRALATSPP